MTFLGFVVHPSPRTNIKTVMSVSIKWMNCLHPLLGCGTTRSPSLMGDKLYEKNHDREVKNTSTRNVLALFIFKASDKLEQIKHLSISFTHALVIFHNVLTVASVCLMAFKGTSIIHESHNKEVGKITKMTHKTEIWTLTQ